MIELLLRISGIAFLANEIRGLIMVAPVMVGLYQAGGTWLAIYMACCSVAGIALSLIVPAALLRTWKRKAAAGSSTS